MQQSKRSTIWTHGEHPKHMQNQWRSALIFKREAPKRAGPRAFARFGQWLIRPCGRYPSGKQIAQLFCQASFGLASTTKWSWSVAYAENFHGVGFIQWHMMVICICVRCLWRHNLTSCSCYESNVLAKFVDIISVFFYTHSPYFINSQRSKLGYRRKIHSMLRHSSS